jgi:mono/diheme cytochrome c family protein
MKHLKHILIAATALSLGLVACNEGKHRNPGRIYAPDMTYSRAYEFYSENPNFSDSSNARMPVMGTIARGHALPDHLVEGDTNAYKTFNTAHKFSEDEIAEGKRLFNIYCGICHGAALDGNGPLYASGKFAAMPANLKGPNYVNMPVGQIYAAIKFGKNAMGSYASQLDPHQRWMIIAYIKQQQASAGGYEFTMGTAAAAANPASTKTADTTTATKGGSSGAM